MTRTTRSVSPTEAGESLIRSLALRIEELETEIDQLVEIRDKPSGTVRITLSDYAQESVVWPKLRPVLREYPDIKVELNSDNGFRNIVEEKFDAGVRLDECVDKDTIAVRIGPDWRLVAVASPEYLKTRTVPKTPQELVGHDCINHRQARAGGFYAWEFEKDGREVRVRVDGQLTFNTSYAIIDAAVAGYGIAYVPETLVERDRASGRLIQILDDWSPLFPGYYLFYHSRRQNSPAFRVIVDALKI